MGQGRRLAWLWSKRTIVFAAVLVSCTGDISKPPVVASVEVTPASAPVQAGATVQLRAVPRDQSGRVLDAPVTWSSSASDTAAVDAQGLVNGKLVGSATITATAGAVSGAAVVTVSPGPATALQFAVQPGPVMAGAPIAPAIMVHAVDAFGNQATGFNGTVSVSLAANPGGATLSGTTSALATGGKAQFDNLILDKSGSGYTLQASAGGLTGTASDAFVVSVGPAAVLVFSVQPTSAVAGAAIAPAVEVSAQDTLGNTATSFTGAVTLALAPNAAGATPAGTLTQSAVGGVATFDDLSIDKRGTGYTLTAAAAGLSGDTSASFDIMAGEVAASQSGLEVAPGTITASAGTSVATVTVTVRDSFGNPVPGVSVVLAATGAGNTLTQPAGLTDTGGIVTGTLSSTTAETKTVTAAANGVAIAQSAQVVVAPAAARVLAFTVQPSSAAAGAAITPAVEVVVRDSFGNLASGYTGNVTLAIGTNPGGGTLSGTTTRGAVGGAATFDDLSIDKRGTGYTLTAAAAGLSGDTSASFDIMAGEVAASQSGLEVAPGTITASAGTSVATVTVTVRDSFGNPVPGVSVVLAATGAGNTLTQPAGLTDTGGIVTGTLSSTTAETKTVTAAANGVVIAQSGQVVVAPAAARVLAFTVQPSSAAAGAAITPAVEVVVRDSFGNLASGYTGNVTLAIGTNPGGGTLSGTTTRGAVGGVATFDDLSIDKQGTGYTLTGAAAGLSGDTSASFDVTAGSVSSQRSELAVSPAVIQASAGASVTTITVTARDKFGNPVQGATVVVAAAGSGNTLLQPSGPTDADGHAMATLSSEVAEDKAVSAVAAGIAIKQQQVVTVTSGPATVLAFTLEPRDTVAGASINDTDGVKVSAQDAFGNTDQTYTQSIALAIGTNPGGGVLSGVLSRPAVAGVATFTDLSIDKAGTGYTLGATGPGVDGATSRSFDVAAGAPVASQSVASASPASIQASSGSSVSTISVTIRDLFGNPVTGATVILQVSGSANAITQPSPTDATGSTTGTLSSTAAESKLVTVAANGVVLQQQPAITVTAGPVSAGHSAVRAVPDTIEASGGGSTANVVVTAKDAYDNVIVDSAVTVAATGAGFTLSQANGTTDGSGVYANATVSGTTVGDIVVSATVAGVPVTQRDTVTVVPGEISASRSTVVAAADTVAASSGSGGTAITVTARDDMGNAVPGANVVLSATGSGNTMLQPNGPTNASGVATGTLRSTVAEAKVVTATIAGTGIQQTDTVTVIPAAPDSTAFLVQPSGATVDSAITPAIQVAIHDRFGNLVASATNDVTLVLSTNPAGATLTGGGPIAAVDGVAVFPGVSLDKAGMDYRLTATASTVPHGDVSGAFSITGGAVSASQSSVTASPATITASTGSSVSVITVTARDAAGSPVSDATVVLSAGGSGNTLTQPGPTDANGVTAGTLSATGAGSRTITAVVNGVTISQQATVTVTAASISATQSAVMADPQAIEQGTGSSAITVTVSDAFGNPVNGAVVTLAATGSGNTLTQPAAPTDASGVATGALGSSSLGQKIVSATAGGIGLTQTDTVTVFAAGTSVVMVGAGDIATCKKTYDEATAAVVVGVLNTTPGAEVFTLGDNVYENGTTSEFNNCYDPSWGVFKNVTHPSTGNHEYNTSGANPYFAYFGAAAGPSGKGYYSYDIGAWHVVVLNSNISTSAGSAQEQWLRADLAAHPNVCTLAYWHHPLYYSTDPDTGSTGGTNSSIRPFWNDLYAAGADLVLNGHRHVYERFAPMRPDGTPDASTGIREIIVGTGGDSGGSMTNIFPTSEVREGHTYGVLKLTLQADSYSWEFLPIAGKTFTDSGTTACH